MCEKAAPFRMDFLQCFRGYAPDGRSPETAHAIGERQNLSPHQAAEPQANELASGIPVAALHLLLPSNMFAL
jgi:hypothetical protein